MTAPRVAVIIPCFNEAASIASLLEAVRACGPHYLPLVVDDGSDDATCEVASALAPTVRLVRNCGIGTAVQTGIRHAFESGCDYCVQLDGDGQHPPDEVARLIDEARRSGAAVVVGSRYLDNDAFRSTPARRLGNHAIAAALRALFPGCAVTDPTSGMRLMDRKAMRLFARRYPHDFPEPISLAWALKAGLAVAEVPVHMRGRSHGSSSINGLKPLSYMIRVIGYIVLARLSRHGAAARTGRA